MSSTFQQQLKNHFISQENGIYEQERRLIDLALNNLFGYFLLQIGSISNDDLMEHSRVNNKVLVDSIVPPSFVLGPTLKFVKADLDYLPIGQEKVDVVLLPHTLEAAEDPHYLLRQIDSMLVPEGGLVITGFNPKGCWVRRNRWFNRERPLKDANLYLPRKIKEWLKVLGYEIKTESYSPIQCSVSDEKKGLWGQFVVGFERFLKKFGFQFGNVYCIVARKKVDAPTLVGLKWQMPRWQSIRGSALNQRNVAGNSKQQSKQYKG